LVLIDCAPNLNVLNKSALIASDWVLIPARADHLSTLGIEYLVKYLKTLIDGYNNFSRIRAEGDPRIPRINPRILGIVFTMVQLRADEPIKANRTFIEEVQALEGVPVFDCMIRLNTALFAMASRDGVPVSVKSSVPAHIALELDDLAQEFIEKAELKRIQS
jgi:chromosome partitioning protein